MRPDDKPEALLPYESHPPSWLPKAHSSAELGHPGYYPPQPHKNEDILTGPSIKNGYILGHVVSAETFSAQATLTDGLRSDDTITKLEELMNEIFVRRNSRIPSIPPSTFRIPSRITLNDSKRQAWFADLANPDVPLYKLGKNVPHGAKGHDLLDLLHSNDVAIPRAVWFLRVFGANETTGLRNKPTYNPTQYSVEWANLVTSYLKKQLAEIKLPSAPRPGLNIKQTFKGVLADFDSRERWISRLSYCLQLLRTFYSEGLVDNRTFLVWIVEQMSACNLAQAGFVTRIADEYLDGMLVSRAMTRPFVDACLSKLAEIRTSTEPELLVDTEGLLKSLLQRICIALPDAFISPRMWADYQELLSSVLSEYIMDRTSDPHLEQNSLDIQAILFSNFVNIRRRNEAMLFRNLPSLVSARLGSAVSDVELLNSISHDSDLSTMVFFPDAAENASVFGEKLSMLLTWSITPLQFGDHRPLVAVTLTRHWRNRARDRATRRGSDSPDELLQDHLFHWLDTNDVAGQVSSLESVALLFGKLVKDELFSYPSYIQRLIARGEPGLSSTEAEETRHRRFLRRIPLSHSTPSLINQRRVTLYGVRARESPEDANEKEIRKEIRGVMPELFNGSPLPSALKIPDLLSKCDHLITATRFEQVRVFRLWLAPLLRKYITSDDGSDMARNAVVLRTFCVSVELMARTKCFRSILDLTLCMLQYSTALDLLQAVVDTLRRYAIIWASMDVIPEITTALYAAHQLRKTRGTYRSLLLLLMDFDGGRYLPDDAREQIITDMTSFTLAVQPITGLAAPVPDILPEILLLATEPGPDAPQILANALWIKYRRSHDWAWKTWDNTVASLRQIPHMRTEVSDRRESAHRYGTFLLHVDQHLPAGLDAQVLDWFLGRGRNEVTALTADAWDIVSDVLLFLSVHGAIKTTTILSGLVYPSWLIGATAQEAEQSISIEVLLTAINALFRQLVFQTETSDEPVDLLDDQCIRTRRQDVYQDPHFRYLVGSIPVLLALENNEHVSNHLRVASKQLRHALCEQELFRRAVFRNVAVVREAFERPIPTAADFQGDLTKATIAALKLVLCEPADDLDLANWTDSPSLLSPWKISATTVHLQFVLRQMGESGRPESKEISAGLDKLTSMLFQHTFSSEEAYFVAEMTKGVGSLVSGKFINNGVRCLTDIIARVTFSKNSEADLTACLHRAGELLRVLIYVSEPSRPEGLPLLEIDPTVQDKFISILCLKFHDLQVLDLSEALAKDSSLVIALLARFLQFYLGLRGVWTPHAKGECEALCGVMYRLILRHSTGSALDLMAYPLLLDTFYYLLDEIPGDPKAPIFDPFRCYPDMSVSDLPSDLPAEYHNQLRALLPFSRPVASVANLASCHRDSAGNLVVDSPVANRPWEWIENLGEPVTVDSNEDARYVVKNSGSLSLDTFGARMTGDRIIPPSVDLEDARIGAEMLQFEDCLAADNIFQRDWRETRVDRDNGLASRSRTDTDGLVSSATEMSGQVDQRTPRGSPSSSGPSTRGGKSGRQSPALSLTKQSTSTMSEVIDVDSIASGSSSRRNTSKRRAPSDDDIVVVEGPSKTKKQKSSKASPKLRTKRR
ncbi:hypothetical protein C8J56DRAFT_444559 [Mycena floridula]|nr:hypothetical protein C8J56DRAFT_444559 [Mycena floridula]